MARPREFDTDTALNDAMNVFWQHGYDAASLPVLLQGMGLTRGSLYKAFVDKKSLFLKVLDRYETEAVNPAVTLLTTGPGEGASRIAALFQSVLETAERGDHRGCMLCSAAAGPAAVDADISEVVHRQLHKMNEAFYIALTQSEPRLGRDEQGRRNLAGLLLSQYVGLRVLIRSNAPVEVIRQSVQAIFLVLGK